MLNQHAENTVFKRYNTAIVVVFVTIVFIALAAASFRYYSELATHKNNGLEQLNEKVYQLNTMLSQSEQALLGIKAFAEQVLNHPEELNTIDVSLKQNGEQFFLNKTRDNYQHQQKPIRANITGLGQIKDFSLLKKQEIAMANALTPAFVTAQKVIPEAFWFYYVSLNRFVSIYPWIDRKSWHFTERMLTNPHAQKIQQQTFENHQVIWSSPYFDAAGQGMNTSIGIGVYKNKSLLGAVMIDISLAKLQQSLPELEKADQGLVLFNQQHEILFFKKKGKDPLTYRTSWQKALPEGLNQLSSEQIELLGDSVQVGDWFIEKQALDIPGWTLIQYQPYSSFILPLRSHFIYMFAILLAGLIAFLMLVNSMTRRSFIKPTHRFIQHIEYCSQGDPGKIKPNADWLHWFILVEDIFTQNRSLLLQLQEQNEVLDSRVQEKTEALQETSEKHQRDNALLRSVMNAIPDLIIFNDIQGRIIGCNQPFENITGYKTHEMLGQKSSVFMPRALGHEINRLNENFDNIYPQEALIEAGEYIYQGFCNEFTTNQGEVLGTITILQDVTVKQATQTALETAKNQAEYANQVKIQFLANMSHEIRTPINAMQGMMALLNRTALNSSQQHYLENAQRASFSLLHLVDELLDLSKIEAGKMIILKEYANLTDIIDKAVKLNVANIHRKNLQLHIALAPDVPSVIKTDEMRLLQVLSNLLNNSVKFTDEGSVSLIIDTIGSSESNALVRFKVKDTGIGIAKENQKHLFEAFSQADISMTRKYGGSGLGLSICQQIVKLLGGEITLESEQGKGCEFNFILPFVIPAIDGGNKDCKQNTLSNVELFAIDQTLSTSCIKTVESLGWQYQSINTISELCQRSKDDTVNKVLLVNEKELYQQVLKAEAENIAWNNALQLVALCQPTMLELSTNLCQKLDQLAIPYILLDTPLYRFSLEAIARTLVDKNSSLDKSSLSDVIKPNENDKSKKMTSAEHKKEKQPLKTDELLNIKVLLAEDNLVNQLVAKELLQSMQAEVVIAENGQRALDILANEQFDVVLMDIQMPIMDGLTAAKLIRENELKSPEKTMIPIIAMTAHAREEDKQTSLAAGMNLHIAKPVTNQLLRDSILQVISLKN